MQNFLEDVQYAQKNTKKKKKLVILINILSKFRNAKVVAFHMLDFHENHFLFVRINKINLILKYLKNNDDEIFDEENLHVSPYLKNAAKNFFPKGNFNELDLKKVMEESLKKN